MAGWTSGVPRDWNASAPDVNFDSASDDTGDDASYRELALCQSSFDIINFVCDWVIDSREVVADSLSIAFSAIVGVGSVPFGPVAAIAGALAVAAIDLAFVAFKAVSSTVLGDQDARDNVACCLYNTLAGTAISQANFELGLNACSFNAGSYEDQIAGAIRELLKDEGFYAAFIDFISTNFALAADGDLSNCPCTCPALRFNKYNGTPVGQGDLAINGNTRILTGVNYNNTYHGIWVVGDDVICPNCELIKVEILSLETNGNDWIGGAPWDCDYQPVPGAPHYQNDPPSALIGTWESNGFNITFDGPWSMTVRFSEL
jgi:hypothetical protein